MNSRRGRGGEPAGQRPPAARSWQPPPRILVVDSRGPHWACVCHKLCDALENVLSLACSLAGPPRIPLLSLYVAQNQQECLLPFMPVRGSFTRLLNCIAELRALRVEGAFRQRKDVVNLAVQEGLQQFKQYTRHRMEGAFLGSSSVEVTVLTCQPGTEMVKQLEAGLQGTDLVSLRQLQVLEISSRGEHQEPSDAEGNSPAGEAATTNENSIILGTDVDLQTVENDTVALETFFKAWLHDRSGSDEEDLHLLLPTGKVSPFPTHGANLECVKCDIQERLVSPTLLSASWGNGAPRADDATSHFWTAAGQGLAPRRLRVVRALKAEGLCESLLFGLPLVARPTTCWQLTWDELEANQQSFQALCHCLQKREWLLLATSEPHGPPPTTYHALMPASDSSTLLLRAVAVRELILPCSFPLLPPDLPGAALNKIERILDNLDVEATYNPLNVTSRLYNVLRSRLAQALPSRPQGPSDRQHLPQQQTSRQIQSKARATVAPLRVVPAAGHSFSSAEEEELLDVV